MAISLDPFSILDFFNNVATSTVQADLTHEANEYNIQAVRDTNQANKEINQANLDYNAAMTQAAWERDDNAHQREVRDLQAAGLSPLASTGGLGNTSPLGAPNPIAMQAPQVDYNSLISSLSQSRELGLKAHQLYEDIRHNKSSEKMRSEEILNDSKELSLKSDSLNLDNKRLQEEIRYQTKLNELAADENYEFVRSHKENEKLEKSRIESQKLLERQKLIYEELKTKSNNQPYVLCTSPQEYTAKITARNQAIKDFLKKYDVTREGSGKSSAGGGNLSGSALGFSLGTGGNGSKSNHDYKDYSKQMEADWNKLIMNYPFPIADYDKYYTNQIKMFREAK